MKVKVYNQIAEEVGEQELSPDVFGLEINEALVHQVATAQMANQRQTLAHTKVRNEVRGGGKKPWKQKGTGRARAGSSRSPIWIGGGITFGPRKDVNFSKKVNDKMKQKATLMALSDRAKTENLAVLDKLELKESKTKKANEIVSNIEKKIISEKDVKSKRSFLIIVEKKNRIVKLLNCCVTK